MVENYNDLIQEEILEWKKIESEMSERGIPWWADLRQAKISGKNFFWRNDPRKEAIIRGEEKRLLLKLATSDKRKNRVLDLGCGSGWLSLELGRLGMDVTGIDISQDRLNIAKKYLNENPYRKNFGKVKYLIADLNKVNFKDNSFDVIVVWDTLHHFPNLDEILKKCQTWLADGGKFVAYDHVGNRILKTARKVADFFAKAENKSKIIPYEDTLGKKMTDLLRFYFDQKYFRTRLSFPVSILLYLLFSKDIFLPMLPLITKIDKFLCDYHIFYGEYIFFYGVKK